MLRKLYVIGLVAVLVIAGCRQDPKTAVVGSWLTTQGKTAKFESSGQFGMDMGRDTAIKGSWKVDGGDIVLSPESVNGKPIADILKGLKATSDGSETNPQAAQVVDRLSNPIYLSISPNGSTLTLDKVRTQNADGDWMLTKQG